MKSLVTGGAGFIGSHLVDRLINIGHEVVVIDNESAESNSMFYWNDNAKNYKLDVCDYENTKDLYAGVDYVFHLAAEARIQPSIGNPLPTVNSNFIGTTSVLEAAKNAGVKRVIYSSTSSSYGRNSVPNHEDQQNDCLTPYSVSKVAGEDMCKVYYKLYGLETISLRYFNVYGERQPIKGEYAPVIGLFHRQLSNGHPMTVVGDGTQRRDFTHVDDAVDANILAATKDIDSKHFGTIFNIGRGKNYSINEIVELFGGESINIPARPGESKEILASNLKARAVLGWEPKVHLKDYIQSLRNNQ
jgi:UDP-glucose 4-epimerase